MRLIRFLAVLVFGLFVAVNAHAQFASLSATAISGSQITITVGSSIEGMSVGVRRWTSGGSSVRIYSGYVPYGTSFTDGSLASGTTYYYCPEYGAFDELGNFYAITDYGACGSTVSATTYSPPAAPSGMGASAVSGTQINLSWSDNSSNETGFKIERKTGAGGSYAQIAAPGANTTSYSNTGLANGTTYYYRVRATNAVGDSGYSGEAAATTVSLPAAPSGLSGVPASTTQINLSWSDNSSNETGFRVERKTGSGGTYSQITVTGANATGYNDTGVTSGSTYYYRVTANNSAGDSGHSNEVGVSFVVPTAPTGLSLTDLTTGHVRLDWTDASDSETGFKVERKTGSGGTYAQIATPAANATTYEDSGLTAATTYYYRVRAAGIPGDSAYSNEVSITATMPNVTTGTVTYTYDVFGNLTQTNAGGVVTTLSYDLRGRKTSMVDPDMGTWTYAYNALGELIRQVDAKSQTTTMAYDALGRMTTRTEADLTSTWTYDSCTKGVGKLCTAATDNSYSRTHTYDSLGRPSGVSITVDGTYTVGTSYDSAGRVDTVTYPTGFVTQNVYNTYGYLEKVQDTAGTPTVFWQATAENAAGQVTSETLGNGLVTTRTYDALFRLTAVSATGSSTPHSQTFAYDPIGNLTQRVDVAQSVTENFAYDTLNRLNFVSGPSIATRTFDYDAIGNMVYKADVGVYTYPGTTSARPHAVSSVDGNSNPYSVTASYTYDANGNLSAASGTMYTATTSVAFSRTLTYMSFNAPNVLTHVQGGSTYSYTYTYSAEHERARLITVRPDDTLTTIYIHPAGKGALLYEKETHQATGVIEYKHYITGGAGLVGVYVTKSSYDTGEGPEMRYYHKDHLGSIAVITNPAAAVIERLAYEPFGERRQTDGSSEDRAGPIVGATTDRGFTGHEHLDEMMLIHMNGRIFDPVLGRFMTPDPNLQAPENLQSYNRYSYVLNSPLAGTDPSGYFWGWVAAIVAEAAYQVGIIDKKTARTIEGIAIATELGPKPGSVFSSWVTAGQAAGAGFTGGFVAGDFNVQAGINGAFSALLFYGAGSATDPGSWARVAAHAAAGCASAVASGGECGPGALSAGFSEAALGNKSFGTIEANVAIRAVVGGTASVLGGGKFSNGAITASFAYLFNQAAHSRRGPGFGIPCVTCSAASSSEQDLSGAGALPRDRDAAQATRESLTTDQAQAGQLVYRVWGGGSPEMGPSWTPLDPQIAGGGYRNLAGLPNWNAGTNITIGRLIDTVGVMVIPATPLHGNAGGWPEYRLTRPPATQIQVLERFGVAPPY